jgi:sulfur carrier protein ThiS
MKVLFINNKGGGFAGHTEIAEHTTVAAFFKERMGGNPDDYLIRINRQVVPADYVCHAARKGRRFPPAALSCFLEEPCRATQAASITAASPCDSSR